MSSYQRGSRMRRAFPWLARLPGAGALVRQVDELLAIPIEWAIIDARVRARIEEARRRNAGATSRLELATALGQKSGDAWQLLGGLRSVEGMPAATVAATLSAHRAAGPLAIEVWRPGDTFPSVLLACPSDLESLWEAPCIAVFIDDTRILHSNRIGIARTSAVFAANRGVFELARLYHPVVLQAPNATDLAAALRIIPTYRPQPPPAIFLKHQVLFQVDDFKQGGLEQVVTDLIDVLPDHGCQVSLLVLGELGPATEGIRNRGVAVHSFPANNRKDSYRTLLRSLRPTVINAHHSIFGAELAAEMSIPFVQTIQSTYTWLDKNAIVAQREASKHTSAYVCVSKAVALYSSEVLGLPAAKMTVISNAVDTAVRLTMDAQQRRELRRELTLTEDDFVFINVAAVYDVKAQLQLVRALRHVESVKLLIVGGTADPDYKRQILEEARQYGVDSRIIFAGQRGDARRCLLIADAFVLPSFWEGDSLALIEAVLANLPIVATDAGRAAELIDAVGGRLVSLPFASIADVRADTIQRYLTDDERMVDNLAQAMRSTADNPRPATVSETLREALDRRQVYGQYASLFSLLQK